MDMINAFFVEVGIDRRQFDVESRRAALDVERLRTSIGAEAEHVSTTVTRAVDENFRIVQRNFLTFFAVLMGARSLRDFVETVTRAETQLGILATALGTSVPQLSAFEMAVQRVGGSIDGAASSLAALNDIVMRANLEGQAGPPEFYRLGGGSIDPRADRVTQMIQLADAMARTNYTDVQKMQFLQRIGIDAAVAKLLLDPVTLRGLLGQTTGDAVTQQQAEGGTKLTGAWFGAQQAIASFGRQVLLAAQGPMTQLLNDLKSWVEANKDWATSWVSEKARQFKDWVDGIDWAKVGQVISSVAAEVKSVADAMGGWKTALLATAGAWALIKGGSVLALGVGLAGMTQPLADVLVGLTAVLAAYKVVSGPSHQGHVPLSLRRRTTWWTGSPSGGPGAAADRPSSQATEQSMSAPEDTPAGSYAVPGGNQIETAEGTVGESRPMPVKVIDSKPVDDTFWGYASKAIGKLFEGASGFLPRSTNIPGRGSSGVPGSTYLPGRGSSGVPGATSLLGGKTIGKWWTADRINYAVGRLQKESGLSYWGALTLVSTWAGIEAPGGPSSFNLIGKGHYGIAQWDPDRAGLRMHSASYEDQVTHAIQELNTSEGKAARLLRNAQSPEEADFGVRAFERGGYAVNPVLPRGVEKFLREHSAPVNPQAPEKKWWEQPGGETPNTKPVGPTSFLVPPAARGAASASQVSMMTTHRNYEVSRVVVHATSMHASGVAREVREALQRELSQLKVA
jgi:hypothetical protein